MLFNDRHIYSQRWWLGEAQTSWQLNSEDGENLLYIQKTGDETDTMTRERIKRR